VTGFDNGNISVFFFISQAMHIGSPKIETFPCFCYDKKFKDKNLAKESVFLNFQRFLFQPSSVKRIAQYGGTLL
jgi:hypothetical protein